MTARTPKFPQKAWSAERSPKAAIRAGRKPQQGAAHPTKPEHGRSAMTFDSDKSPDPDKSPASEVCLLLRAHAEARWLSNEVAPVLREIEQRDGISDQQLGAALAYLEVLWIEACARARETESARVELDALDSGEPQVLYEKARRFHAAVRRLRAAVEPRIGALLAVPSDASARDHAANP
jgi:hypothetical protein